MIGALQRFADELRRRGLEVSPAEVIDAARAARAVGPEERKRFRAALAMTLAKDLRSQRLFDEAFAEFFAPPARAGRGAGPGEMPGGAGGGGAGGRGAGEGAGRPRRATDDEEPPAGGSGRGARRELAPGKALRSAPARPGEDRRDGRKGLRALGPAEIRRELAKGTRDEGAPGRKGKETRAAAGLTRPAPLRDRGQGVPAQGSADERARNRPGRVRLARLLASEQESREGGVADARRRDLRGPMTVEEERRLAREIPRILEELRLRHSRRYRRAPRGRLWMKRAIRENLGTGGVPFRIPMRGPVRRKARIVMIVDVSWSVVRASGLFLMLALELLRLDRRVRVHLFVDHPVDATDALARWLRAGPRERPGPGAPPAPPGRPGRTPAGRAAAGTGITARSSGLSFAGILDGIAGLDPNAASDYGRTFWALRSGPLRSPGRDSVLVVLGDGRANRFDPLCWAFEELASRARRVIWLVPEARDRWGTGDSALPGYLPFCDVAVEARDLEGLAHGVRELAACL